MVNLKSEDNESIEQIKAEMNHRVSDLQRILDEKCQENENLIEKLNKFQGIIIFLPSKSTIISLNILF